MKRENVLASLLSILSCIKFSNEFLSELAEIVSCSGYEKSFFRKLMFCIKYLLLKGASAVNFHDEFESICDGLFSMHVDGKGFNIRILYSFLPNRQPVLLLAFFKRSKKKVTDYSSHTGPAMSRLLELRKDYENG